MSKPLVAPLRGERLRLRLIEPGDLPLTLAWRNQDHIRKWFVHSDVLTLDNHRAWFLKYVERDNDYLFLIEETERLHKPIGQVGLYDVDWRAGSAEYGRILIGETDARGAGYAKEATSLLLGLAFDGWGLRSVDLEVYANNAPAIRIYQGCGFEPISAEKGMIRMRITDRRFRLPGSVDASSRRPVSVEGSPQDPACERR